jgi:hypothetical protein
METIHRDQIKAAEYNPRTISDANKGRLKKGLKKHGLVQPLVWNKRTGNLVAGHQRLEQIDTLEKSTDYEISVSVVDVSEAEEKILNVMLNNDSMMGEWDIDKLKEIGIDGDIDFSDMGFSDADISILFGDDDAFADLFADTEEVSKAKADLSEIKKDRKKQAEKMKKSNSADFYFTVVCDSQSEKDKLYKQMGILTGEDYIGSHALDRLRK